MFALLAGLAAFSYRFLSLRGFTDDHHVHVAGARQMLAGEWPTRDFVDPGLPFMFGISALAQAGGGALLAETLLVAAAFGVGASISAALAWRFSGSLLAAGVAVALQVLIYPRTYSYPKVLLYALGALAILASRERPSTRRLAALAAVVVVAFLFRHDHGVLIGAAGLSAVALAPWASRRARVGGIARYVALVLLLALPYLTFVAVNGGVRNYVRTAVMFSRAEAERNPPVLGRLVTTRAALERGCRHDLLVCAVDANAPAVLQYAFYLLPVAAVATAGSAGAPVTVPIALLGLLVNVSFMRDALRARIADAVVPASLLLPIVLAGAFRARGPVAAVAVVRAGAVAGCAVLLACAAAVGQWRDHLHATRLLDGPMAVVARVEEQIDALRRPRQRPSEYSSRLVGALIPHLGYMDRCLAARHRLFVPGFAPDVFVYAERLFAGGNLWIMPGYFEAPVYQQDVLRRLERQVVPLAILRLPAHAEIARHFPAIEQYLQAHFEPLADAPLTDGDSLRLLVNRTLTPTRTDPDTGWPCFR